MSKSELFKQAIAEAKELKDISMAQAKQQIAEAFAPRIQEMFRAKVEEMESMDEADEMEENVDKMEEMSSKEKMAKGLYNEEDEINETSLDEILAELESDDAMMEEDNLEEGIEMDEAKKADDKKEDEKEEEEEVEVDAEEADAEADDLGADLDLGTDADAEGQEIVDLSVEDFKNLVRDVVADVLANHGEPDADNLDGDAADLDMGADMDMPADDMGSDLGADAAEDDAISLDEILAELENEGLEEADEMEEAKKMEENDELEEAVATIEELKATINEMNLFNAKLLYTNKIFEAKSLNNTQKAKVLNAFDKAANLNEVKAIFKTLTSTLDSGKKTQLKESLGFASKAVGSAPAKPILEENAYVTRFQQLAGIKKSN
jgi:hypothetical protein